jgi:hypothetical protein
MPLKKIPLQSGFNKQFTASQAEGQWIDGDNVRFRYGSPEKIGGWQQITNNLLVGVASTNKKNIIKKCFIFGIHY